LAKVLLGLMAVASCRTVAQEPPTAPPSDATNAATVGPAGAEPRRTWALKYVALPDVPFSIEGRGDKPWLLWATIDRDPNPAVPGHADPLLRSDVRQREMLRAPDGGSSID
jgi:hypothetical protein